LRSNSSPRRHLSFTFALPLEKDDPPQNGNGGKAEAGGSRPRLVMPKKRRNDLDKGGKRKRTCSAGR
jgi:hypothetical protein